MKRLLVFLILAVFAAGALVTAEESKLIDFSDLVRDYPADQPTFNERTMMDYSTVAGTSFSDNEKDLMKTSLSINEWEVVLASSSRTVQNQSVSMTLEAQVSDSFEDHSGDFQDLAGQPVMGIRVHFPTEPYNSYAVVQPPFEIPAYADLVDEDSGEHMYGAKFNNYGVVKNVGVLKSVSVRVRGLNFPHGLSLILKDQNGFEQQVFLGYLDFDGWKTLTWTNPNYVTEVRNREIRRFPLYPQSEPHVALSGILITRDAAKVGGDFVTYVKDISLTYDKAVLSLEREINDESVWGILQKREEARRTAELRRLGNLQVLRYLERQKMHQDQAAQ